MNERFNGPEFLGQKFQDIHTSEEAQTLAEYTTQKEDLPHKKTKQATIDRYLKGLDRVVKNRPSVAKMIEESITDDYVLDVEDSNLVASLALDLYESEKKIAVTQGRGADIQNLNDEEMLEKYRQNIIEKAQTQKESLDSWFTYLKEGEDYPMWFKYYVVRSLKKMGQFNRDTTSYGVRTKNTIASFPEVNAEALGFAYKAITGELEKEGLELNEERKGELEQELDKRLASKDFGKLYAFAQVECAGNLDRESLEGEWVIYPQGSDYKELEKRLKGKGTGWCTASGSAQGQLANGDFHVFYSKNKAGIPTEPRIAVRMENREGAQSIAEVRGIDPGQALEPALIDIARDYYSNFNGAEKYEKADNDMKMLTEIYDRCFQIDKETKEKIYVNPALDETEIRFLYEIDSQIVGFGYNADPRIKEILSNRNSLDDAPIALGCKPEEVAWDRNQLNETSRVYIGPLFPGVFKLPLECIYISFPEEKINTYQIEIGGKTRQELDLKFEKNKVVMSPLAEDLFEANNYIKQRNIELVALTMLRVEDLKCDNYPVTTEEICEKAEMFGLEPCPPDTGIYFAWADDYRKEDVFIMIEQMTNHIGGQYVYHLYPKDSGTIISLFRDQKLGSYNKSDKILFRRPILNK